MLIILFVFTDARKIHKDMKNPLKRITLKDVIHLMENDFETHPLKTFFIPDQNLHYIVSLSGGPDSIFLTYLYHQLKKKNWIQELSLFHFNHQLRKESNEEEDFVIKIAKTYDLPIFVESLKVFDISKKLKLNLEETARILRYRALLRISQKLKKSIIITGHNADDYMETLFLRWIRGSSLNYPYFWHQRNIVLKISKHTHSLQVLSPLLLFEKSEILKFLEKNQIDYKTDLSNFDIKFKRNYIRHKVLEPLKKIGFCSSLVWQRTHLQLNSFASKEKPLKEYFFLESDLFENFTNREIKIIFDQITRTLGIAPLQKEILFEFIKQSYSTKIYIESKEIIISSSRNRIWFIRTNSTILKNPNLIEKEEEMILEWHLQKRIYKKKGFVVNYLERESNPYIRKKIKEALRKASFPKIIRNKIPYIVYKESIQILASFLENFWDLHISL